MEKLIKAIFGTIPNTEKSIHLDLREKNLIITGRNGSGKTFLLTEIYNAAIRLLTMHQPVYIDDLKDQLNSYKQRLDSIVEPSEQEKDIIEQQIAYLEQQIETQRKFINLSLKEGSVRSDFLRDHTSVLLYFNAQRSANITHANSAKGITSEPIPAHMQNQETRYCAFLEQRLVDMRNRWALSIAHNQDLNQAREIEEWLNSFENNIKFLMEDDSITLDFDTNTLKYTILREDFPPTDFQSLSSGYSAIFSIYGELLMRTQYFNVTPSTIGGIVLIDEIESHLHVSLQRLILPFFENSFPHMQFIVTSHSPFVLTSTRDNVIYDTSSNAVVDNDISMYSYSAVMEGILDTKSTSVLMERAVSELLAEITSKPADIDKLIAKTDQLTASISVMDKRSRAFYEVAMNIIQDVEEDNVPGNPL